jgi:ATP-binding cassette subfamily B protein
MSSSEQSDPKASLWSGLKAIYALMTPARQRQFLLLLLLMFVGAFAELGTIGAVMPFLALLASGAETDDPWLALVPGLLRGAHPLLITASVFIFLATVAGLVRLRLLHSSRSFIFQLGHELMVEIQRRLLSQPFSFHVHRNTNTLLTALHKTEILVADVLLPLMNAVVGGVIAIFVVVILLFVDPLTTLVVAAAFTVTYVLISLFGQKRLLACSMIVETAYDDRLKVVQESLGGVRDVILDNSQQVYLRDFASIDAKLARARATLQIVSMAPRYLIETVGIIVIASIAFLLVHRHAGIAATLPILGALALGGQRLLPLVQNIYAGWTAARGQESLFGQMVELLSLPLSERAADEATALKLSRGIALDDVTFVYPTRSRPALHRVSLTIPRGTMLALVGPTGSGKSTLVDVLMGLLEPNAGRILIDEVPLSAATVLKWHRSVAHVPQSIFLADASIERNIALSLPEARLDHDRIVESAKTAQLHDFIMSLPEGYDTYVGERGIRLSGGQRQRLGIARAIYKGAPILVLDEATSALDDLTETAVIAALEQLRGEGRTIIIVAHRQSTLRHCDVVARLEHGRLVEFRALRDTSAKQRRS